MTRCPQCDSHIDSIDNVQFVDLDTEDTGLSLRAPKRLYIVACDTCNAAVGGGVAGAE